MRSPNIYRIARQGPSHQARDHLWRLLSDDPLKQPQRFTGGSGCLFVMPLHHQEMALFVMDFCPCTTLLSPCTTQDLFASLVTLSGPSIVAFISPNCPNLTQKQRLQLCFLGGH